jgi:hypothetical protein
MSTKSGSGSGMKNPDHISECLFFWVKILKFFERIRDQGWKKLGSRINIPDPQHCPVCELFDVNTGFSVCEESPDRARGQRAE